LGRYIAMKGSITVDGISLTVAGLGDDWFEVAIIPHTWRETILSDLKPGDSVNLEVDVLAKYVERLMLHKDEPVTSSNLTLEYLIERGY
jgi:riboflavin synthase